MTARRVVVPALCGRWVLTWPEPGGCDEPAVVGFRQLVTGGWVYLCEAHREAVEGSPEWSKAWPVHVDAERSKGHG